MYSPSEADAAREQVATALAFTTALLTTDPSDLPDVIGGLLASVPADQLCYSLGWLVMQMAQMVATEHGGSALSVVQYLAAELHNPGGLK